MCFEKVNNASVMVCARHKKIRDLKEKFSDEIDVEKKENAAHPSQAEEKDNMAAARDNSQLAPSVYIR